MRVSALSVGMLPLAASAINVLQSNDDGWAEINIREFFNSLTAAGFNSIISAPAENMSGSSSLDAPPTTVDRSGCEYHSCPEGSPPTGSNSSMPQFNYVNSYPVTSMKYGIQTLSPKFFGRSPDIALAGLNVGINLGLIAEFSGTVGATTEAVKQGIPGIAFPGATGSQTAWNAPVENCMTVSADLSTTVTQALVNSGKPYLPSGYWLNVNYPAVGTTSCSSVSDFRFVLSRLNAAIPLITPDDVKTCNNGGRLPTESHVVGTSGCFASISVGVATTKLDAAVEQQALVLKKLRKSLSKALFRILDGGKWNRSFCGPCTTTSKLTF